MGAIARHVLQVKRKNSTSCSPPEARLTVVGSVASRFGPREVATGSAVGAGACVAASVASVEESTVGTAGATVDVRLIDWGCVGAAGDVVGAHAANKTANSVRCRKKREFNIYLL